MTTVLVNQNNGEIRQVGQTERLQLRERARSDAQFDKTLDVWFEGQNAIGIAPRQRNLFHTLHFAVELCVFLKGRDGGSRFGENELWRVVAFGRGRQRLAAHAGRETIDVGKGAVRGAQVHGGTAAGHFDGKALSGNGAKSRQWGLETRKGRRHGPSEGV